MKKIFHLSTCNTCQKIIAEIDAAGVCELQDIKKQNISATELDAFALKMGSYEALFSRKAMKFRQQGWHEKAMSESDYRNLILEEYTFLKRPVMVIGDDIYAGNTKVAVAAAKAALEKVN